MLLDGKLSWLFPHTAAPSMGARDIQVLVWCFRRRVPGDSCQREPEPRLSGNEGPGTRARVSRGAARK